MSKRRTIAEGWIPINHGIKSSYSRGCRCDECRAANTKWQRESGNVRRYRGRCFDSRTVIDGRLVALVEPERHGNRNTYNSYGCRCQPCSAAAASYRKARRREGRSP